MTVLIDKLGGGRSYCWQALPEGGRWPDYRSLRARTAGDIRIREIRWCWLLAWRQVIALGYMISPQAEISRLTGCELARERARSRIIVARLRKWTGSQWPRRFGPAADMPGDVLAGPPCDDLLRSREVSLYLSDSCEPLRGPDGCHYNPEGLPGLPILLIARIYEWSARYQWWCSRSSHTPVECDPLFPVNVFNREGRSIARALKHVLPPDWTVVAADVDAWFRKSEPKDAVCLHLLGTPHPPDA